MTASFPLTGDGGVFVIAEAGVNHDGDVAKAERLIEAAAQAKADAVKFQTWKPGEITGRFAYKVSYMDDTTAMDESRYELSRRLCLPYDAFRHLQDHARRTGILFLSTPDGFDSLDFLVDELKLPCIKIGSTELTHPQFLEAAGRKGLPVILSTGIGSLGEVEEAVAAVRRGGSAPLALLHCTSQYPAPDDEINLRAMTTLRAAFGLPVGLSDHSTGLEAGIAATAMGACIVEKHFTLDRSLPGPDHRASLDPEGLADYVRAIRRTACLLGDGQKRPTASELRNASGIRRSVVAARDLPAGTALEPADLICKRPADGVPPAHLPLLVGRLTKRTLEADEPIRWIDVQ
ncbi:N-acetylneuraminate synthase family protein (plasmid) [Azospirillum sp. HJ39]|uniref:N-acetylneuraminate synthase family protein n=1 Tax=Azospirillum sp. HJ39 TaxID=3159496 RepID=UPI0035582D2E